MSTDPFRACKVPTIFVVGSEGHLSSIDYLEVRVQSVETNVVFSVYVLSKINE